MDNIIKLLKAIAEAQGYEVKTVHTKTYGHPRELTYNERSFGGIPKDLELEFIGDGLYKEVYRHIDYKVTKKQPDIRVVLDEVRATAEYHRKMTQQALGKDLT